MDDWTEPHLTDEQKLIVLLTSLVREADMDFEKVGGGTRHWVRDCFLPVIEERGYKMVLQPITKETINESK